MAVSVSFGANQLKKDVFEIIGKKVDALTTNDDLRVKLQRLFYTYAIQLKDFPEDTGALKLKGAGYATHDSHGYYRRPAGSWSGHHGIEFDAIEERTNKNHHYGEALKKFFGDPVSQGMIDAMMCEGLWDDFVHEAAPIIAEAMKHG